MTRSSAWSTTLVTPGREVDMAAADETQFIGRARRVPELKPGKYSDGLPLDTKGFVSALSVAGAIFVMASPLAPDGALIIDRVEQSARRSHERDQDRL